MDCLQGSVDIGAGLEALLDRADRVDHGRVIAVEAAGDLRKREVGLVAGDVHGELTAAHRCRGAARRGHVGQGEVEDVFTAEDSGV